MCSMHKLTLSRIDNDNNRGNRLTVKIKMHEKIKMRIDKYIIGFCNEIGCM